MKTVIKNIALITLFVFASCEEVIDVDVQNGKTRLVIEASLDWEKGTTGSNQTIKLSTSTPYFDTTTNTAVNGASVIVTNDADGAEFIFADQNNGAYITNAFIPVIGDSYTLEVVYNGERYLGKETLASVPDILETYQTAKEGFDADLLEVNLRFIDPEEEKNYYLFKFLKQGDVLPNLDDFSDEFVNGNEVNWWYEKEDDEETKEKPFASGDIVDIELYSISESFYNYVRILIEQAEGVGLFSATPVALKGNCINLDTPRNYAHGYFRVTQVEKLSYTFK